MTTCRYSQPAPPVAVVLVAGHGVAGLCEAGEALYVHTQQGARSRPLIAAAALAFAPRDQREPLLFISL